MCVLIEVYTSGQQNLNLICVLIEVYTSGRPWPTATMNHKLLHVVLIHVVMPPLIVIGIFHLQLTSIDNNIPWVALKWDITRNCVNMSIL